MSTKRKVYTFYIIAILVMVLVLMSLSYNIQLNNRIAERHESLDKGNNK